MSNGEQLYRHDGRIYAGDFPNVGEYLLALSKDHYQTQNPVFSETIDWAKGNVEEINNNH